MSRFTRLLIPALLLTSALPALAQQSIFTLRVLQNQNVYQIANGQALNFVSTAVGQPSVLTLTGTYTGATTAIIGAQPQVLGSPDFTVSPLSGVPLTLAPNASFSVNITYNPSSSSTSVAQLVLNFSQTAATTTGQPTTGSITLNLNGQVPNFSVNYFQPPANNITPILNGGTITFPATLVNTSNSAAIVIANTGTGPSSINSIIVTGAAFQVQGLGLLPAGIAANSTASFVVKYSPLAAQTDTGTVTIGFPNQTFTINLTGTGTSSIITYSSIDGQTVTPLTVGQQLAVPDTPIGVARTIAVQVQNTGTAAATINSVSLSGNGFALTNLPVLPITLAPASSFTFNLTFTPTQAGAVSGTLTIGADRFQLVGNGLGAQLTYSYISGTSNVPLTLTSQQTTVLFTSVALAQSSSDTFTVTNSGTSSTTLTSVGIVGGATTSYTIPNLPPLPAVLAPGASFSFTIVFSPATQGLNSATLLINGVTFSLSAFGTTLPAFPQYTITGLSGSLQPFTQPSFSMTIAQPYPLAVSGTLTMGVTSNLFATDPSVQFATGGRTLAFTIAPGATQAVFANGTTQTQLQTGTVAESITLTPTFTTANGVAILPPNPAPLVIAIPAAAPALLSASMQNFTAAGFDVTVEGFTTDRVLTKLTLTFGGTPGLAVATTTYTVDVSQASSFWFRSPSSQTYGGLFSITIPISAKVSNATPTTPATLSGLLTLSATITNDVGTSNSASQ